MNVNYKEYKYYFWSAGIVALGLLAGLFYWIKEGSNSDPIVFLKQKSSIVERESSQSAVVIEPAEETASEKKEVLLKEGLPAEDEKPEEKQENDNSQKKDKGSENVINKLVSWGYVPKDNRFIDTVVIHSSYDAIGDNPYSVDGILKEYKSYGVAAHYLISREGKLYKLVEEQNIAYHAGESKVPDGRTGVNNFSIGIELVNTKTEKCTQGQYDSLKKLLSGIKSRYKIKYVLGHNEIAPERKDDPWGFDWKTVR